MPDIEISSQNYNGKVANVTFYSINNPLVGINIGTFTLPFVYSSPDCFGTYECYFSEYESVCQVVISPTPTPTPTLTMTPTISFTPTAVLLTTGTSYTVPSGATTMKAWAVGAGRNGAGGTAYKTWSVSGGDAINYVVGVSGTSDTTITYSSTTITGNRSPGNTGGSYSGGDGGANGGNFLGYTQGSNFFARGGAIGGNISASGSCNLRYKSTDVSGLTAAATLAGQSFNDDCASAVFGYGGAIVTGTSYRDIAGRGGGGWNGSNANGVDGAVVLYFT
jgi:hypothetical protein